MNFSEKYYKHLTTYQHKINNEWFINKLKLLKDKYNYYCATLASMFIMEYIRR